MVLSDRRNPTDVSLMNLKWKPLAIAATLVETKGARQWPVASMPTVRSLISTSTSAIHSPTRTSAATSYVPTQALTLGVS
jgi:hypothetical protein